MFGTYTTADQRDAVELRAEIARLIYENEQYGAQITRQAEILRWIESQQIVSTPELCWVKAPGDTLCQRVRDLLAAKEIKCRLS